MSITNEQILDAIAEMSVMQVVELISAMEEKFGVSAAAAVVSGPAAAAAVEEQTEFNVILAADWREQSCLLSKQYVAQTGLGLKRKLKSLVDGAPASVKEAVSKEEAEALKKELEEAGATVEVK